MKTLPLLRLLNLTCALLWLAGCSHINIPPGEPRLQQAKLKVITHWQVKGKLAVSHGKDSNSGYLTWGQQQARYDIYLAGPFGAKASRLQGDDHQASMLLHGWQQPALARSAEELMATYLGWVFPVNNLRYWVKGQPAPLKRGHATPSFNEAGLLERLEQQGWVITYGRYREVEGNWLPHLIRIQNLEYKFTLAISAWTLYEH